MAQLAAEQGSCGGEGAGQCERVVKEIGRKQEREGGGNGNGGVKREAAPTNRQYGNASVTYRAWTR